MPHILLVPILPTMVTFTNTDNKARIGVGRAIGAGDKVVSLEYQLAIGSVAIAGRRVGTIAENAAAIPKDDNVADGILYFLLDFRCFRNAFEAQARSFQALIILRKKDCSSQDS
jgi:hypothetical protein